MSMSNAARLRPILLTPGGSPIIAQRFQRWVLETQIRSSSPSGATESEKDAAALLAQKSFVPARTLDCSCLVTVPVINHWAIVGRLEGFQVRGRQDREVHDRDFAARRSARY